MKTQYASIIYSFVICIQWWVERLEALSKDLQKIEKKLNDMIQLQYNKSYPLYNGPIL